MRFRTHHEEGPTVLSVSRARPGVFGKGEVEATSHVCGLGSCRNDGAMCCFGRNKDFLRTPPDVFLEKGCQSRGM